MKNLKYVVTGLLLCVLLATGCSTIGKSGLYYGVATAGKNIVFVVDVSGSMEGKNEGNLTDQLRAKATQKAGQAAGKAVGGALGGLISRGVSRETTKLASVKRELGPAIRGLDPASRFTIVTFSNDVNRWKEDLVAPSSSTNAEASLFVERLDASGGTAAMKGLRAAFSVQGADTIFFLSDGYPSDGSADTILRQVRELNQEGKIVIHAIGVGDDKDEQFLKDLAAQNGGRYAEG